MAKVQAFTIILKYDVTQEEGAALAEALRRLVKDVVEVYPVTVNPGDLVARARERRETVRRVLDLADDLAKG